jgi:hypothetical protein
LVFLKFGVKLFPLWYISLFTTETFLTPEVVGVAVAGDPPVTGECGLNNLWLVTGVIGDVTNL